MNNQTTGLLVVDLQPAYAKSSNYSSISAGLMQQVLAHIETMPDEAPVLALHVNEDLSGDTLADVQDFWLERGADDSVIDRIRWSEKSYAFLRGWMDNGIADEDIVATVREMRRQGVWDSRAVCGEELQQLSRRGDQLIDPLFRDEDVERLLTSMRGRHWNTCGGGRDECLLEVELVLRSADLRFERLNHLTY